MKLLVKSIENFNTKVDKEANMLLAIIMIIKYAIPRFDKQTIIIACQVPCSKLAHFGIFLHIANN